MYQPYPGTTQMPDPQPRDVPASVRRAVTAMYAGAAASLVYLIASVATQGATKSAIEKRFPHLSASQVSTEQHVQVIAGIVAGLVAIGAWLLIARACRAGKNWARITGTVLFAIATLDAIGGLINPVSALVKVVAFVVWLAGLAAVVLLWRAASTAYFKATRS
jgi:hypothetical protein